MLRVRIRIELETEIDLDPELTNEDLAAAPNMVQMITEAYGNSLWSVLDDGMLAVERVE